MNLLKRMLNKGNVKYYATIDPLEESIEVKPNETLLEAALKVGLPFPNDCRVGTCGTCKCRLQSGKVKPIMDFSYTLKQEELKDNYILACQSLVSSDVHVKLDRLSDKAIYTAKTVEGVIGKKAFLTHDILEITVQLSEKMNYVGGQYAHLTVPKIELTRPYSFSKAPDLEGSAEVSFFVRRVPEGQMSGWLHAESQIGDKVIIEGSYGSFWLRPADTRIICIAGGSGLAPLKSLLEQACREGCQRKVTFLFGARTQADLYCLDDINSIINKWKGDFEFIPVLSNEPMNSEWTGERGMVTDLLDRAITGDEYPSHAYLCGPPPMIDAAIVKLKERGISVENIHYDKF